MTPGYLRHLTPARAEEDGMNVSEWQDFLGDLAIAAIERGEDDVATRILRLRVFIGVQCIDTPEGKD